MTGLIVTQGRWPLAEQSTPSYQTENRLKMIFAVEVEVTRPTFVGIWHFWVTFAYFL